MPSSDDYLPHYRSDLTGKAQRIRDAILHLVDYKLPNLEDVSTEEYELIRLAVINSIKGETIAHEERSRQKWVESVYLSPSQTKGYLTYQDVSSLGKCDFQGEMRDGTHFGLEVKGGEGNSVTLLSRPANADFLCVWSHLDVMSNSPGQNMRAVLGRVVKQMVNNDEKKQLVDYLVFYDKWYTSGVKQFRHGKVLPDVIVFPTAIPTKENQHPTLRNPARSYFLQTLYEVVGGITTLDDPLVRSHVWLCDLMVESRSGVWYRKMKVYNWHDSRVTLSRQDFLKARIKVIGRFS